MAVVVLCGSARFETQFKEASTELTKLGHVVIGLGSYPSEHAGEKTWYQPDEKEIFDLVHLDKVLMADVVLIIDGDREIHEASALNYDGYVGFSTAREILWANMKGKPIVLRSYLKGWDLLDESLRRPNSPALLLKALQVLRAEAGKAVVTELVHDTEKSILHAGLSVIASLGGSLSNMFATRILEAAGLDPMDDVHTALAGVLEFDGTLRDPKQKLVQLDDVEPTALTAGEYRISISPAPDEPWTSLPIRKLIGTIIMVEAIAGMGEKKGMRREMVAKLEMIVETLLESFGVTTEEVEKARAGAVDGDDEIPLGQNMAQG